MPVVTRIYSPQDYGLFAAVVAVAAALTGVSTLRLEIYALREADDNEAQGLLADSVLVAVITGLLVSVVTAIVVLLTSATFWWVTVGPLTVVASFQLIGTALNARRRGYRAIGVGNFVQQAGMPTVQIGGGYAGLGVVGLLLGFFVPRLYWLRSVRGLRPNWLRSLRSAKARRFAATSGGSALLNSTASQLPVLVVSVVYGAASSGLLAIGMRAFVAPLALVGQALSSASNGEVGECLRRGDHAGARRIVRSGVILLAGLGVVPALLVFILSPTYMGNILGESWAPAGPVVQALVPGAYAQLCTSAFAQTLNISDHSSWLLGWDTMRMVLIGIGLAVPRILGADLVTTIWVYSAAMAFTYIVLGLLVSAALLPPAESEVKLV